MKSLEASFFVANRQSVMQKIEGGILVIAGYTSMQRGNDAAFGFEQESNFWYATGIEFPDWWVIIDASRNKSWLVEPDIDEQHRLFEESLPKEVAQQVSGITDILSRDEAMSMLRSLAKKHPMVRTVDLPQYHDHFGFTLNPAIREMRDMLARTFKNVVDIRTEITKLRAIKQPIEIEAMQDAINVTIAALQKVKTTIPNYSFEYQVEADITHHFRSTAGAHHAYDPIVAGGANACLPHYFTNNAPLKKGTLLMMDVGARKHGYCADLTRTYGFGKTTKRQQQIHGAVQQAQREIIELLQPGLAVEQYQRQSDEIMKRTLVAVGLMTLIDDTEKFRRHFPHMVSHGLGIDVHDALGRPRVFEPGMVVTVEPGIYIPSESIGVRIEDDILITKTGHINMSAKLSTDL
jgi:Xaa-Pro aminopeptidase